MLRQSIPFLLQCLEALLLLLENVYQRGSVVLAPTSQDLAAVVGVGVGAARAEVDRMEVRQAHLVAAIHLPLGRQTSQQKRREVDVQWCGLEAQTIPLHSSARPQLLAEGV